MTLARALVLGLQLAVVQASRVQTIVDAVQNTSAYEDSGEPDRELDSRYCAHMNTDGCLTVSHVCCGVPDDAYKGVEEFTAKRASCVRKGECVQAAPANGTEDKPNRRPKLKRQRAWRRLEEHERRERKRLELSAQAAKPAGIHTLEVGVPVTIAITLCYVSVAIAFLIVFRLVLDLVGVWPYCARAGNLLTCSLCRNTESEEGTTDAGVTIFSIILVGPGFLAEIALVSMFFLKPEILHLPMEFETTSMVTAVVYLCVVWVSYTVTRNVRRVSLLTLVGREDARIKQAEKSDAKDDGKRTPLLKDGRQVESLFS